MLVVVDFKPKVNDIVPTCGDSIENITTTSNKQHVFIN